MIGVPVGPVPLVGPVAHPRIMVVGDSISQGSSGDYTWRYHLFRHLREAGVEPDMVGPRRDLYDNVGRWHGASDYADPTFDQDHDAAWGRMLSDAAHSIGREVRVADPDYLLVLLGINDLTFGGEAPAVESSVRLFINNARSGKSSLAILLGTVLPTEFSRLIPAFARKLADFNARLATVAAELSTGESPIRIADTAHGVDVHADLYDGTHPNSRGEMKIAQAFADGLARQFGVGSLFPLRSSEVPVGPQTAPVLTAAAVSGAVLLSWTRSPGATVYWVWLRPAGADDFVRLERPLGWWESPWAVAPLHNGLSYELTLRPAKGTVEGVFSNIVRATPG